MSTTKESTWWTAYWFQLLVVMFGLTIFYIFLFLFFMHAAWDWCRSLANGLTLIPQRCHGYRWWVLGQSILRDELTRWGWGVLLNHRRLVHLNWGGWACDNGWTGMCGMVSNGSNAWFPCLWCHSIHSIPAIIIGCPPLSSLHCTKLT